MIASVILLLLGGLWVALVNIDWRDCDPLPAWPGLALVVIGLTIMVITGSPVQAAAQATPSTARMRIHVPEASAVYRRWVERAVAEEWGIDGSPARLAAQLHQESSWNPKARSSVGAEGLAQFMPSTARWIAQAYPDQLGQFDPWDPQQALMAAAIYDAHLVRRNPGASQCATWAFALSAYNGGEGRLRQEQELAEERGRSGEVWFGNVADQRARGPSAWRENRGYVSRILLVLEPAYIQAGWDGKAVCT